MSYSNTRLLVAALALLSLAACGPGETPGEARAPEGALAGALEAARGEGTTAATWPEQPYVTVRFERAAPAFADDLYVALKRLYARYPEAELDIVLAIPPLAERMSPHETYQRGEEQIEDIVMTMTGMGLPPTRLRIAAMTDTSIGANEIRIYVRPPTS